MKLKETITSEAKANIPRLDLISKEVLSPMSEEIAREVWKIRDIKKFLEDRKNI